LYYPDPSEENNDNNKSSSNINASNQTTVYFYLAGVSATSEKKFNIKLEEKEVFSSVKNIKDPIVHKVKIPKPSDGLFDESKQAHEIWMEVDMPTQRVTPFRKKIRFLIWLSRTITN